MILVPQIESDKCEGPATCLPFLGIVIDTMQLELRLPFDKLQWVLELVIEWWGKKACTKSDPLSLIGLLQQAVKVVRQGCTFVRYMISLSMVAKKPQDHPRLNKAFGFDLEWWYYFISQWNGLSLLAPFSKAISWWGSPMLWAVGGVGPSMGLNGFNYNGSRILFSSISWTKSLFPS